MGLVTLTLKLAYESHQRWGTFLPNLGTLGLCVLQLLAMYMTDGQKQRLMPPLAYVWGHNKKLKNRQNSNNKSIYVESMKQRTNFIRPADRDGRSTLQRGGSELFKLKETSVEES